QFNDSAIFQGKPAAVPGNCNIASHSGMRIRHFPIKKLFMRKIGLQYWFEEFFRLLEADHPCSLVNEKLNIIQYQFLIMTMKNIVGSTLYLHGNTIADLLAG